MPQKKFIVTQDESVANKLVCYGFHLLSNVSGTYTFVNQTPQNFTFDSVDKKKLHFTNIINI